MRSAKLPTFFFALGLVDFAAGDAWNLHPGATGVALFFRLVSPAEWAVQREHLPDSFGETLGWWHRPCLDEFFRHLGAGVLRRQGARVVDSDVAVAAAAVCSLNASFHCGRDVQFSTGPFDLARQVPAFFFLKKKTVEVLLVQFITVVYVLVITHCQFVQDSGGAA